MLPERKNISLRSLRIPCDLLQRQINPLVCPCWTPNIHLLLPGSYIRILRQCTFYSWEALVSCVTSSVLIKTYTCQANSKKSICWNSRAWALIQLLTANTSETSSTIWLFKWLFKRSKNCCWSKYYLKNCMNKFKTELLRVARYKLNYGKAYLSLSPAQTFC